MPLRRRSAPVFFARRRARWRPAVSVVGWLVVLGLAFAFMVSTVSRIIAEDGARVPTSPATAEHDHGGLEGVPSGTLRLQFLPPPTVG